jgi:hypothetical protein
MSVWICIVSVSLYLVPTCVQYPRVGIHVMGEAVPDHTIDGLHYDPQSSVLFQEQATVLVDVSPIDVVHTPIIMGYLS